MKSTKIILSIIVIFYLNLNPAHSKDKISFINLDSLIKQTNIGKVVLNDIDKLNKKNIEKLKIKENELKSMEDDIKKKTKYYIKRGIG